MVIEAEPILWMGQEIQHGSLPVRIDGLHSRIIEELEALIGFLEHEAPQIRDAIRSAGQSFGRAQVGNGLSE